MSDLSKFKGFVVQQEGGNVVIDYNQKVIERIESIRKNMRTVPSGSGDRTPDADGFISGLDAKRVEELTEEPLDPETIIENAKADAEGIVTAARIQSEDMLTQARREAEGYIAASRENGYAQGMEQAKQELAEKMKQLEAKYAQKEQMLMADYEEKVATIEPMLVDTLIKVFDKVTHTMAEDKKDMIIHLINSVMKNNEISTEFFIRVSPDDYKFTVNNQDRIYTAVAKDIHIEISQDASLSRNECIIETDAGVFDCSLDIQLENLISDIRLLCCTSN